MVSKHECDNYWGIEMCVADMIRTFAQSYLQYLVGKQDVCSHSVVVMHCFFCVSENVDADFGFAD